MKTIISRKDIFESSRILIVDDTRTNRMMLRAICSSAGFQQLAEAVDGRDCLAKVESFRPDLILLDMTMPIMDGLAVCRHLQRAPSDAPVIIMQTTFDSPEFKATAFDAGVTDFITKPVNSRDLVARMLGHLERRILRRHFEANYHRVQEELQEAAALQGVLLPDPASLDTIWETQGLDLAYAYHPFSELGGDYLAIRKLSPMRTLLVTADVSGHGLTAALYAFALHSLLQDDGLYAVPPGEALTEINTRLRPLMMGGKFSTMFLGIIDTGENTLKYAAAAAPPPILFSSGRRVSLLETRGFLLGALEAATYQTYTHPFVPGDTLFLYSDALTETPDKSGALLEEKDLVAFLSGRLRESSAGIITAIENILFDKSARQTTDDLSLLVCRRPVG